MDKLVHLTTDSENLGKTNSGTNRLFEEIRNHPRETLGIAAAAAVLLYAGLKRGNVEGLAEASAKFGASETAGLELATTGKGSILAASEKQSLPNLTIGEKAPVLGAPQENEQLQREWSRYRETLDKTFGSVAKPNSADALEVQASVQRQLDGLSPTWYDRTADKPTTLNAFYDPADRGLFANLGDDKLIEFHERRAEALFALRNQRTGLETVH